jgi:Sulfotransferase family
VQRVTPDQARGHQVTDAGERPVFLLGAPRSGTTLLYKVLCMHPAAAWVSNWVRSAPQATALAAFNRIPGRFPGLQRRVWFGDGSNAYVYGRRRAAWERAFPMPVEGEPIFEAIGTSDVGLRPDPEGAAVLEQHLSSLRARLESIRRFSGGSVFINKRIGNNRRIGSLLRAFPSARFVDLVRDGRAVAYSLSNVDWWPGSVPWWHDRTPERWQAEGGDPWELCARSWVVEVAAIERGLQQVPSEQVLHLSYEQLIGSPLRSVQAVATFAGLPGSDDWLNRVRGLTFPNRNDAWRERLSRRDIETIEDVQRETLVRYGYAL